MSDPQEFLSANEAWAQGILDTFPERASHPRIDWSRDGLSALFRRLEELKGQEIEIGMIYDETTIRHARARRIFKSLADQENDLVAQSVDSRTGDMVSRGMAAEERMLSHRTRAIDVGLWRRRYESLVDDLDSLARLANTRHFALSAEREDIRAQIRSINVAIELGEI